MKRDSCHVQRQQACKTAVACEDTVMGLRLGPIAVCSLSAGAGKKAKLGMRSVGALTARKRAREAAPRPVKHSEYQVREECCSRGGEKIAPLAIA